jgi:predicted small lipoprotein YifL
MKLKTMLTVAAALVLLSALAGCSLFGALDDSERVAAFIETANATTRDNEEMQSHWSSTAPGYRDMVTDGYWNNTFFNSNDKPFTVSALSSGGEVAGIPGTSSLSGTITSKNAEDAPVTFGLVPDATNPRNRLLRVIVVEVEGTPYTFQNIR